MLLRVTKNTIIETTQILYVNYYKEYNCIEICLNAPRKMEAPCVEVYPRNWFHRRMIFNRIMSAMNNGGNTYVGDY